MLLYFHLFFMTRDFLFVWLLWKTVKLIYICLDSVPLVFFFFNQEFFGKELFYCASFKKFKAIDLFRLCHAFYIYIYIYILGSKVPLVLKEFFFLIKTKLFFIQDQRKFVRKLFMETYSGTFHCQNNLQNGFCLVSELDKAAMKFYLARAVWQWTSGWCCCLLLFRLKFFHPYFSFFVTMVCIQRVKKQRIKKIDKFVTFLLVSEFMFRTSLHNV